MTIADMLAKNAKLYPDDIALVELKPSLNYRCEITWRELITVQIRLPMPSTTRESVKAIKSFI